MNKVVPLIKRKILDNSLDYAKDKMVANKYVAYLTAFNNSDLFSNTANLKKHTIVSFDGRELKAYERIVEDTHDYVIMVHDFNKPLDDMLNVESAFNEQGFNTIRIIINNNLFEYSKAYLDVILWANYFKEQHLNNRIYLYGNNLGANIICEVLKTDVSNIINAVVIDKIEISPLERSIRNYCIDNKFEYHPNLIKLVKSKILKKYDIDLTLLDNVSKDIDNNLIPIIFISELNNTDYDYQNFLSIYNSTKGIKKILFVNKNIDDIKFKNEFYKVINELKKF